MMSEVQQVLLTLLYKFGVNFPASMIIYFIFYSWMSSDIFLFPAICLAIGAGNSLRYFDRGLKLLFFKRQTRSEDNYQTQNTTQSIFKIVEYS
jgi:hypothetical protein